MQRIDRYEVRKELGRGGAGAVFEAWDPAAREAVAIKLLLVNDPRHVQRFRREARILEHLDHPHVIPVRAWGEDRGKPYLVMDLIQGQTLEDRIAEQGPLPPTRAAELGLALAQALECAHGQGILHRDVKPSNVLLRLDGVPVLTDFGLAKEVALDATQLSVEGGFMGTLGYVAPEQAMGRSAEIGPATDVYGLGATLYHALSGRPPVPGSTVFEVLDNLQKPPVPLTSLRPDLPAPLAGLVHRCLRGPVAERYRDCGLVARDLARFLAGDLNTPHAEERRRRTWLGGTAVLLALAAGAVALWPRAPRGTSPPPPTPPPALPPADSSDQTRRAARAAADAGDWVAARAHYDELLRERPADPEALHGLWHALRELGADGAEAAARRAVDAEPRVDAYLFLLAAAQQRGDPPPRIEALLREGLRALPGAPALLEQLGQRLHLAERDAEALPLLAEAAASEPSFRLDMLLGGVLNRLGREQEALPRFMAAVRRQPDSLQACYFLGYTLVRLDRFQEALPELRRAYVLCDGEYPPLIPLLTEALRETGAYEEARVVLDRALGESPEDLQLLLSRALLHDDMGNPEAELADLSAILALDPDHPTALHNRSVVHFSRGEYELALRDAQREVALVPGSVDAWTQVGGSAFALEQNALARDAFARAIELAPERAPLRIGRGQAAQLLGEWDLAIADFTWALARTPREDPSHGSVRFNLAMTYDSAGRRDLALETMRALQRESPQDEKRQDVARYWIEKWTREAAQRE